MVGIPRLKENSPSVFTVKSDFVAGFGVDTHLWSGKEALTYF